MTGEGKRMLNHHDTMTELAQIIRGQHSGWSGDKRENAGCFLRIIRDDFPEDAKTLAFDIECNSSAYIESTGLPERTLFQASRILFGLTGSM
jgi:hypothetical protein